MLVSEVRNWKYIIFWDNAKPADSSSLIDALEELGNIYELTPSTTVALSPTQVLDIEVVKTAIKNNLDTEIGNAVCIDITKSGTAFHIGTKTDFTWQRV